MSNIDSDLIRGNIDTIILKTMLENDMYGLDIIKEVETRSNGTYILKQPTLYSCLKRLENQELISSYWLDSDIGGRRHYYKLTDKGRETLVKKQEEWAKSKFIIDNLLSDFNYDEYRLVKKDDYDRIIEGKTFEYNPTTPAPAYNEATAPVEEESEPTEESATDEDFETTNDDNDIEIEDFNNLESNQDNETYDEFEESLTEEDDANEDDADADEEDDDLSEDTSFTFDENFDDEEEPEVEETEEENEADSPFYFSAQENDDDEEIAEVVPEADQSAQESNILAMLRNQDDEEINTYYGDQKSYVNHLNLNDDDLEVEQQNLLDQTDIYSSNKVDDSINEFNEAIAQLSSFSSAANDEGDEPELDEQPQEVETFNFQEIHEQVEDENLLDLVPTVDFDDEFAKELGSLKHNKNNGFFNSYDNPDYDVVATKISSPAKDTNTYDYAETDSSDASYELYEDNEDTFNFSTSEDDSSYEDNFSFASVEENKAEHEVEENIYNSTETPATNEVFDFKTFDDIISSNATSYQNQYSQTDNNSFVTFKPSYTSSNYKQKLSDLSAYSKVSIEEPEEKTINEDALAKATDIDALKAEFEKEGIKMKEFRKYNSCEQCEKTYILVNKMKFINSLILLFGYVFLLSAVYIILNNTGFKDTYGFSFKYFLYAFIPFGVYAIYHTVMYLINPYKKVPAKLAPRVMIFISLIITVQLLLITYCVNLQCGFYSFSQEQYNHLLWVIPAVISFAPIVCNAVYVALFYSKNFNV